MLHYPVYALGPGRRAGLWLQGCTIHCPGCISCHTWPFDGGESAEIGALIAEISDIFKINSPDGLTISGGEPFDQPESFLMLLEGIKKAGIKDVLVYSGYSAEAVLSEHPEIAGLAAALVGGPFEQGNETDSAWRGSANQTLSVFRPELAPAYAEWEKSKKGRLQVIARGREILVAGIPRQGDAARIQR